MADIDVMEWADYIEKLSAIQKDAADKMRRYLQRYGTDWDRMPEIGYALATRNGEAAAALVAEMYDAAAAIEGVAVPAAVPAATATFAETADALRAGLQFSQNENYISSIVGRLVKQAGADTAIQNAKRDNAEWAWVPMGDTCAFCITLASNGWQPASRAQLNGGHAEHIHANCDCMFAIRHDPKTEYKAYHPEKYEGMYRDADPGGSSKDKINAMRREFYAENKEEINAQKRDAYAKRTELNSSKAEEKNVGV